MATIALDELHYALLTDDTAGTGTTYETPKKLSESISATITPAINTATLYADNGASETASALGEITLALNTKDLPKQAQADLLGHTIGADGALYRSADDKAPYAAIGFRSGKANGSARFVWLYKGKFQPHEQTYNTKGSEISFATPTINANFVKRTSDGRWQVAADSDDETITDQTIFDNWFGAVHEEGTVA